MSSIKPHSAGSISEKACHVASNHLVERSNAVQITGMSFELRQKIQQGSEFVVIKKSIRCPLDKPQLSSGTVLFEEDVNADDDDVDDEAAIYRPSQKSSSASVLYSIVHSQTYQVPVLYFSFRDLPLSYNPRSIDTVYRLLVPRDTREDVKNVGVLGGIGMTNHPVTDFPSFFVHPCNTAEAMQEILGSRAVGAFEYLLIWLGLVGSCVGLHVPKEMALDSGQQRR